MKKYVQVGCGHRGVRAYSVPLAEKYQDVGKLCGVYDTNSKRAALVSELAKSDIPVYDDFDKMLDEVMPDSVIVTCKDSDHDYYIVKALEKGCDVISEKPVTTTFEKALKIKDAQEKTGKDVIVTFNLRFQPFFKQIKELVKSGEIGEVLSVHFEWMLNTYHGADYFRRWHRIRENSGSLLVHKSTHHFDIVNWLLEDEPLSVNAYGTKRFYGPTREERGERCLTCKYKDTCEFYFDIDKNSDYEKMYHNCEEEDGYFRDKCVFSEEIDIEDSISVNVEYTKGAVMSYSLIAHSPYEGLNLCLNGTKGRLEVRKFCKNIVGYTEDVDHYITFYDRQGNKKEIPVIASSGEGHGGADDNLRDALFKGIKEDPLCQMADLRAGMMSIAVGAASNISMKENRRVYINEFLK